MDFDVTVEIPKGSRNKYVIDRVTGRIRLDRTLFTATQYPADYGFVEDTVGPAGGGDALDAAVLVQEPTFPGCLIRCRAIGILRIRDEQGPTPKVICIPIADLRQEHLSDIADLDPFYRLEIQHFFTVYKLIEPRKSVQVEGGGWGGRQEAEDEIERAFGRGRSSG